MVGSVKCQQISPCYTVSYTDVGLALPGTWQVFSQSLRNKCVKNLVRKQ